MLTKNPLKALMTYETATKVAKELQSGDDEWRFIVCFDVIEKNAWVEIYEADEFIGYWSQSLAKQFSNLGK